MGCITTTEGQSFPKSGKMNYTLSALKGEILQLHATDLIYCYIIATVLKDDSDNYIHYGCGPNFQGGLITLCTCKHRMRAANTPEQWLQNKWIAGFSGISHTGEQSLVYLMKVGEAFESYPELWENSKLLTNAVKHKKSASLNIYGDLFEPMGPGVAFDSMNYVPPHPEHSHIQNDRWHWDVEWLYKRPSALLVGEPDHSFIWDRPLLDWWHPTRKMHKPMTQGYKKTTMEQLLEGLGTVGKR